MCGAGAGAHDRPMQTPIHDITDIDVLSTLTPEASPGGATSDPLPLIGDGPRLGQEG